ncbi:hypothetical protein BB561_004882 [Smittium simulii]|uniref:CDC20/Fizzy WD40 domain-containing protein n=1 Tax=Smittium simulii TaxID=133385 RepID=A0A2T9YDP1_9FUNG|nr:hypothetical protein BB561_004882 [Smittium simulii]
MLDFDTTSTRPKPASRSSRPSSATPNISPSELNLSLNSYSPSLITSSRSSTPVSYPPHLPETSALLNPASKPDRFIPNRSTTDLTSSQYKVSQADQPLLLDSNSLAYQSDVAKACGVSVNSRILCFGSEAPINDKTDFNKLYTKTTAPQSKLTNKRRILTNPDKVLDAPGLFDDYYLNLMDWSVTNALAIALDKNVYLWHANSGEVTSLCEIDDNHPISSIRWASDGSYLAIANNDGDPDRFIPNRSTTDLTSSQYKVSQADQPLLLDSNSLAYQSDVAKACGVSVNSRILCFGSEAPINDKTDFNKLYTKTTAPQSKLTNKRRILTNPDKVLDAPGLFDDYYLNLMDWSITNALAIALDKNVYLWHANSGEVTSLCEIDDNHPISSIRWASDGSYLAIANNDGDVQIWDTESKKKVRTMSGRQSRVGSLSWNNHILSSGSRDGSIWHHDVRVSQHKVAELLGHSGEVCGLKWRSDGALLASGGNDNLVNIWDIRSSVPKFTKTNHTAAVKALDWCPWQLNLLASGGGTNDKHIHFWNTTTSAKLDSIDTGSQVTSLLWSHNYREIMSTHGFPDNTISIWNYPSLTKVIDIPAHDSRILHSAISPDHQTIATVACDENLKFWKIFENPSATKSALTKLAIHNSRSIKLAQQPHPVSNTSSTASPFDAASRPSMIR